MSAARLFQAAPCPKVQALPAGAGYGAGRTASASRKDCVTILTEQVQFAVDFSWLVLYSSIDAENSLAARTGR